VTSFLNVRGVTLDEWTSDAFKRLHLTSETLTWPYLLRRKAERIESLDRSFSSNI
jgi:hypothetical protein